MKGKCARLMSGCGSGWEIKYRGMCWSQRSTVWRLRCDMKTVCWCSRPREGNGRVGDDITAQARTIQAIPLRLHDGAKVPGVVEVRGEIYMPNAEFLKLNQQRESAGEEVYKNPRNLTTGTLKQLDPKITAQRKLRFISHGLGQVEPLPAESYWDWLAMIRKWRLPVAENVSHAKSIDEVISIIEKFAEIRGKLPYQTDGMVVKVDRFEHREVLGTTDKFPRWAVAYKYKAEQMQTELKAVDWQVGKGGTLTPVARLTPVFLAGSTVSNATLHNIDQIRKLDVHAGDTIVVEKAGGGDPVRSASGAGETGEGGPRQSSRPTKCPSCGSVVEKDADGPVHPLHQSRLPGTVSGKAQMVLLAGARWISKMSAKCWLINLRMRGLCTRSPICTGSRGISSLGWSAWGKRGAASVPGVDRVEPDRGRWIG